MMLNTDGTCAAAGYGECGYAETVADHACDEDGDVDDVGDGGLDGDGDDVDDDDHADDDADVNDADADDDDVDDDDAAVAAADDKDDDNMQIRTQLS